MIVYKITNKINNKSYIGQTTRSLEDRIKQHLKRGDCVAIKNAINKYGIDNFEFSVIEEVDSVETLNIRENYYINEFKTLHPDGYNLNTGGFNKKWSEESKKKMSKSHTGKRLSQEHKDNISKSVTQVFKDSPDKIIKGREKAIKGILNYYKNNSHPKKGKKLSQESKDRVSQAKLGNKNPQYGKKCNNKQLKALKLGREKAILELPKVLCHQNNKVYDSVTEAAKDLNCGRSSISNVLIGFRKSCKGYTFEYLNKESA
jgi:group I intron endonuclease